MPCEWIEVVVDVPGGLRLEELAAPIDGNEYIMYHGTTKKNAEDIRNSGFQRSADGILGPGVYLSRDLHRASRYHNDHPESDWVVIKVRFNVGRVIPILYQGHPYQMTWHDNGYDTAWVPPNCGMVRNGLVEAFVWDPDRIEIIEIINPVEVQ